MKMSSRIILFTLTVTAVQLVYIFTKPAPKPVWVKEMSAKVGSAYQSPVKTVATEREDDWEAETFDVYRFEGVVSFLKVADNYNTTRDLFPESEGWSEDNRYAADGHGSSAFAFKKQGLFCYAAIWDDSSDETPELQATEFNFSIDCRTTP